jgi:hypothetical protein
MTTSFFEMGETGCAAFYQMATAIPVFTLREPGAMLPGALIQ